MTAKAHKTELDDFTPAETRVLLEFMLYNMDQTLRGKMIEQHRTLYYRLYPSTAPKPDPSLIGEQLNAEMFKLGNHYRISWPKSTGQTDTFVRTILEVKAVTELYVRTYGNSYEQWYAFEITEQGREKPSGCRHVFLGGPMRTINITFSVTGTCTQEIQVSDDCTLTDDEIVAGLNGEGNCIATTTVNGGDVLQFEPDQVIGTVKDSSMDGEYTEFETTD